MIKSKIKFLIGLLFTPLIVSSSISLYQEVAAIRDITSLHKYLLAGAAFYVVSFILSFRMDSIYVFEHEMTHAVMVWAFGGKVKSIKVSKDGGSVAANKSNVAITLAPYILPVNTALIALIYFFIAIFYDVRAVHEIFMFLVGFSFTMHIILTIDKLRSEQTDFLRLGHLGSVVVTYVINILLVSFLLSCIFTEVSFSNFIKGFWSKTQYVYIKIFTQLFM